MPVPSLRAVRRLRAVLGALVVGVLAAAPAWASLPPPQVQVGATLSLLAPTVEASLAGAPYVAAADGQSLGQGDGVQTHVDAAALLTFFDGSELQVAPETQVHVNPPANAGGGATILQAAGTTVQRIAAAAAGSGSHRTDTPTATTLVRGTTFVVGVRRFADVQAALFPRLVADSADLLTAEEMVQDPGSGTLLWIRSWRDATTGAEYQTIEDLGPITFMESALYVEGANLWRRRTFLDPPTGATWDVFDNLGPEDQENAQPLNVCSEIDPQCVSAAILLADPDGHVGQLELAPSATLPAITLANVCQVAGASTGASVEATLLPATCAELQQASSALADPVAAVASGQVARDVLRELAVALGLPVAPAAPGTPPRVVVQQVTRVGQPLPVPTSTSTPPGPPAPPPPTINFPTDPSFTTPLQRFTFSVYAEPGLDVVAWRDANGNGTPDPGEDRFQIESLSTTAQGVLWVGSVDLLPNVVNPNLRVVTVRNGAFSSPINLPVVTHDPTIDQVRVP